MIVNCELFSDMNRASIVVDMIPEYNGSVARLDGWMGGWWSLTLPLYCRGGDFFVVS